MSEGQVKKIMYVNRKAPYGTIYALESLEVVLIAAAFDQDVSLVFMDDGVYQLKKGHQTKGIEVKNFQPTYRALDDYDVSKLYVEKEALEARGLSEEDMCVPVEVMSAAEIGKLMEQQDVLLKLLKQTGQRQIMLHIVNKSPLERSTLDSCLAAAQPGAAVLLIEDGVYAATRGNVAEAKLAAALGNLEIYVLAPDLEARGMAQSLAAGVKPVDYAGFVELVVQHKNCQSWL